MNYVDPNQLAAITRRLDNQQEVLNMCMYRLGTIVSTVCHDNGSLMISGSILAAGWWVARAITRAKSPI